MLHELDVLEARSIADLARDARRTRDRLLEEIPDAALGEPMPARGQHDPEREIVLDDVLAATPEFVALRDAIDALPGEIKQKLLVLTQIGRGDRGILDWATAMAEASALSDDDIVASLLADPDLHDLLGKGLYALGATPPAAPA
jgi:hypothetical protein